MRLSDEKPTPRWFGMGSVWVLVGLLLIGHTGIVTKYLGLATELGLRGEKPSTPLIMAYPAFAADAQTWVRHALSLVEGDSVRLRFTQIDNGVDGREVHWNSAWAWTIVGAGWLEHWMTGLPLPWATERATLWLTPLVFFALIAGTSAFAAQRAGLLAGILVAVALVGHPRVYEGFFPGYVDHHGLLTVAAFGVTLGAALMGLGFHAGGRAAAGLVPESPAAARRAATFSALSGAAGVWVSAASALPPIGIVGAAGLVAVLIAGRSWTEAGRTFDAGVWRHWGFVGGAATFVFYLLEYFPNHLQLRLESNHPLYSLAWAGGGIAIGEIGSWWTGRKPWPALLNRNIGVAAVGIVAAPLTIAIGGQSVFVVADPFLANLHKSIQEFVPLWVSIRTAGWSVTLRVIGVENIPLVAGLITVLVLRRRTPLVLWYVLGAALLFSAMGWIQSRWLLNASGSQIVLALVLVAVWTQGWRARWRWALGVACAAGLYGQPAIQRLVDARNDVAAKRVSPKDALQMLWRDVAKTIRANAGGKEVVLLTNPNSSTGIGYYGRFRTVGTLYWENNDGLKKAAAIFSAPNEKTAAELVKKFGVTHLAIISEENFIEQYFRLWRPEASMDEFKTSFGYQLLVQRSFPTWLQMIPYKVPDDLAVLNAAVFLCRVAFEQTAADALYHLAVAKVANGAVAEAEKDFDTLIQSSPDSHLPWLRKAELAFNRQDWNIAANTMVNGIRRAPEAERPTLYANAAGGFYREKQHALAVAIYRQALSERFDANLATYLAFALATSSDDSVRNGRDAEALARSAAQALPDSPTVQIALAAALAETGNFDGAIEAASRAVILARGQNDAAAVTIAQQRLELFKTRQPFRQ